MNAMNVELKRVVDKVKEAQTRLNGLLNNQEWLDEARKYAERQGKEVKKLISADVTKVKSFLENERKEMERFQRQIPGEVKKLRTFIKSQRKDLEKLIAQLKKAGAKPRTTKKAGGAKKKTTTRKTKTASTAGASTTV